MSYDLAAQHIAGAFDNVVAEPQVFPSIIEQINAEKEPEEVYWSVWDRGSDQPWWHVSTGFVQAFAFESDAAFVAMTGNGRFGPVSGKICDGYPRQATIREAQAVRQKDRPIALFDRDLNLIRRLA